MNIIEFSGLVLERNGFTYTFFKLNLEWVVAVQKDKKIICTENLTTEDIKIRFGEDVSKFV